MLFDQKEQCAKHPTPVAVHHGKFFKRILPLLPWRLSGVRSSACCSLGGYRWRVPRLELQEDTGPSDSSMRFITSDTGTSSSMRTPQSLSVLEFLFSYGGSKVQGQSLVFSFSQVWNGWLKWRETVFYQHSDSHGRIVPQTLLPYDSQLLLQYCFLHFRE